MNNILKYGYLALNVFFLIIYIINFVLTFLREQKALKKLKENPQKVKAVVVEIKEHKNFIYLSVEFTSPTSLILFTHTFKFNPTKFDHSLYQVGSQVNLVYNSIEGETKVQRFPYLLDDQKPALEKGPLVTNILLVIFGLYATISTLFHYINANAFTTDVAFSDTEGAIFTNSIPTIIMVFVYCVLSTYVLESLFSPLKIDNHNYLKINGVVAKARVVTYKLGRKKNAQGLNESHITLEYFNKFGDKTTTNLSSFMYTEKQEEFIDILYDPLNSKNIVYLKQ